MAKITYTKTNWVNDVTKLNATNMNHIEDGIEAATNATADIPTSEGTGTNSLVGNDIATNTAISENVASFGTGNIGGLKGYYWSSIDIANKTITLASAHTGGTQVNCEYAVGDVISIVNESKYDECSVITQINGAVIKVNGFPFTSVATGTGDFSDYCIYCPAKANIGRTDLGKCAFIAGSGNKGGNYCSVVAGRDNNVIGQYGVAVGRLNKVGYAGFAAGRENTVLGQYGTIAGGAWNNLHGNWGFGAGRANNINGECCSAFGRNNSAGVRGYYYTIGSATNTILLWADAAHTIPAPCGYAIGDTLNAGDLYSKFQFRIASIVSFTGNRVTVSSLGMLPNISDKFIWCQSKSAIGAASLSSNATAFGVNCKALSDHCIAGGYSNSALGSGSIALGENNTSTYQSTTIGRYNDTNGNRKCCLIGESNSVAGTLNYLFGIGLTATDNQCIVGQYNKQISSTAAFIVGAGTGSADSNRKNAMWVTRGGNIVAGGSKLILNGNGTQVSLSADDLTKLLALIK